MKINETEEKRNEKEKKKDRVIYITEKYLKKNNV